MLIRREASGDAGVIHAVTAAAFARAGRPSGEVPPEAILVDELRAGPAWLPQLSLVAVASSGDVIGHVLCTRGHVGEAPVLALGPLTVRPDSQRRGVGSALMHAILGAADALDVRTQVAAGVMARPFAPRCRPPVLILMHHVTA